MFSRFTRRAALLQSLLVCAALTLAGCYGNLPLRYGETLCDSANPCPGGYRCEDSICVIDDTPDNGAITDDEFVGDWDGPVGDDGPIPENFCRTDDQCEETHRCIDGECLLHPCGDVVPPPGESCRFECIPTATACDGVECAENLEYCIEGSCYPTCIEDVCTTQGCDPDTDVNCVLDAGHGNCINDTICVSGVCKERGVACDNRFCDSGFVCSLSYATPDPCDSDPCNSGWTCVTVDGQAQCVESSCSGLNCGPGEQCISGVCRDPCLNVACSDGGRRCTEDGAACCNRVCCDVGDICKAGECRPPEGICDPPCAAPLTCVDLQTGDTCWCDISNANGGARACGSGTCCSGSGADIGCTNPCSPNPCPANTPICEAACGQPNNVTCSSECSSTTCQGQPNTVCRPSDGACVCGDDQQTCSGSSCCMEDGTGLGCFSGCTINPCNTGDNRGCTPNCDDPTGRTCYNLCDGVGSRWSNSKCENEYGDGTVCNPLNGNCECNGDTCVSGDCCSGAGGSCSGACAGQCSGQLCRRDCDADGGRVCYSACEGVTCGDDQNPDCNPQGSGSCQCFDDTSPISGTGYATCGRTNQCCGSNGCFNPCTNNADGTAKSDPCTGTNSKCQLPSGETVTGQDSVTCGFECVNPCTGQSCNATNPDCRSSGTSGDSAQCYCAQAGAVCSGSTCCTGSGCDNPCDPDPCAPGVGQGTANPGNTRCNVNCSVTNDYTCSSPCPSCGGQNPTCRTTDAAGQNAECFCAGGPNRPCVAGECCTSNGCVDPCAGDPCPNGQACSPSCGASNNRVCSDKCVGKTCPQPEPTCDPGTGNCSCYGGNCEGASVCCLGGGCIEPCADNPCNNNSDSDTQRCIKDCSQSSGFRCESWCESANCSETDGFFCSESRSGSAGYIVCTCGGNSLDCAADSDANATSLCCDTVSGPDESFSCQPRACKQSECQSGFICDPCSGCYNPTEG